MKVSKSNIQKNYNQQTTIVRLKCPSRNRIYKKKEQRYTCKKVCGNIFQKCNSPEKILYFRSIGVRTSTSVLRIQNNSDCKMTIFIGLDYPKKTVIEKTINEYQQMSLIVPSIRSLKIKCSGEHENFCKGKYFLSICHKV